MRIDGQSTMVIELEDGLRATRGGIQSPLCCRYGEVARAIVLQDGRQHGGLRQPGPEMPGTPPQEIGYELLEV